MSTQRKYAVRVRQTKVKELIMYVWAEDEDAAKDGAVEHAKNMQHGRYNDGFNGEVVGLEYEAGEASCLHGAVPEPEQEKEGE